MSSCACNGIRLAFKKPPALVFSHTSLYRNISLFEQASSAVNNPCPNKTIAPLSFIIRLYPPTTVQMGLPYPICFASFRMEGHIISYQLTCLECFSLTPDNLRVIYSLQAAIYFTLSIVISRGDSK